MRKRSLLIFMLIYVPMIFLIPERVLAIGTANNVSILNTTQTVTTLAAGGTFSLVIMEDGTLWAWGNNQRGQINDNTSRIINNPTQILSNVKCVAAGGMNDYDGHTLAVKQDGTLWTWGDNDSGQLGNGKTMSSSIPIAIMDGVKSVAAGSYHSLAIKEDGTLWAWGNNWAGQIGYGTSTYNSVTKPKQVMSGVTSVAAGYYHSMAIKEDGTLWAWGSNSYGQLGDGTTQNITNPKEIMSGVISVACGGYQTFVIKEDGTLWAFGDNTYGQFGDGTTINRVTPAQIMSNVVKVAVGGNHTLAIKEDGTLWTWGDNSKGQLGNGTLIQRFIPSQLMNGVKNIAAGTGFSLAITEDDNLWAWGANGTAQLDGTFENKLIPVQIMYIGQNKVCVTGITLQQQSINLAEGQSEQLTATILPTNATDSNVKWFSSDSSIAEVNNGLVYGVSTGTATITAVSNDNPDISATCIVTVNNPTGLTALPGDGCCILIWDTIPDPDLSGYILEYKASDDPGWTTLQLSKAATTCKVSDLENGLEYSFKIMAKDTDGKLSTSSDSGKIIPISSDDEVTAETITIHIIEAYEGTTFDTNVGLSTAKILEQYAKDAIVAVKDPNMEAILQCRIQEHTDAITSSTSNLPTVEDYREYYLDRPYEDILYSYRDTEQYDSLYDFYTVLLPANADIPSVVAGKSGDGTKTVFQDKDCMVDLEFRFMKKMDGKYYYKYKTDIYTYPYDYNMESFIPAQDGKIIIIIRTNDLSGSNDNVGANINIFNSTDIYVDTIVMGVREEEKNRLLINSKVGKVKVYWEANKIPAIPANLSVSNTGENQVTVTWTAPCDEDLAGFQLEYKKFGSAWTVVPLGIVTSYNYIGLTKGISYSFRIKAIDTDGNESDYTSEVTTILTASQLPVITLNGDNEITIKIGDTYIDAGATAIDSKGLDISSLLTTIGEVDTSMDGTYYIYYNVTDTYGNSAKEVIRKVNVLPVDAGLTPPVYRSFTIDESKKNICLIFNESIVNNYDSLENLKKGIKVAANGVDFESLGVDDSVSINDNKLIIVFNTALTCNANVIKIAADTIKDVDNNVLSSDILIRIATDKVDECFIATAAYGSKFTWPVTLFRQFRDQYLMTNAVGQTFVNFYYRLSPSIANFIAERESLKILVRAMLVPIIGMVYLMYHPVLGVAVLALLIVFIAYFVRMRRGNLKL